MWTTRAIVVLTLACMSVLMCAKKAHAQAPRQFDVRSFGAKCDGVTDDAAAIQKAMDQARSVRGRARIPADKTCAYGKVLNLTSAQLVGYGHTSIIMALKPEAAAIFMRGVGAQVRNLKMSTAFTPT